MTPAWNMDLLESVGKNVYINFVMNDFPADEQSTIWCIKISAEACVHTEES
jgi:hypothetical protein